MCSKSLVAVFIHNTPMHHTTDTGNQSCLNGSSIVTLHGAMCDIDMSNPRKHVTIHLLDAASPTSSALDAVEFPDLCCTVAKLCFFVAGTPWQVLAAAWTLCHRIALPGFSTVGWSDQGRHLSLPAQRSHGETLMFDAACLPPFAFG